MYPYNIKPDFQEFDEINEFDKLKEDGKEIVVANSDEVITTGAQEKNEYENATAEITSLIEQAINAQDTRRPMNSPRGREGQGHGGGRNQPSHNNPHGGRGNRGRGRVPNMNPPTTIPREVGAMRSVDSRAIERCMFTNTYVWLKFGDGFWMYITFVGPRSVAGYRWTRFGWTYTGFDINAIRAFSCGW